MSVSEPPPGMPNKCPQCGAPLPSDALEGLCPACLLKQGAAAETSTQPETAAFQPPSLEEMARLFPQLEIHALIGKGGMGAVYKARQPALDRWVALKILPPQVGSAPGFAERFNREARALAKLSHPNIVAVHEFGQVTGLPFFIMEFVDGLNLRQLERAGKLSPREALKIVPQICEALQFAHDEGIVHRDIKPENILLDKKGRVKIADFGIAKIMGSEAEPGITEPSAAIGTPQYMAPEQVEKPETVDHRADIYSLGVVFYEMLTGELPIGKFAPPSRKVDVDVRLDEVVLRALEKEPERRYQHASQVTAAVDTITGQPAGSSAGAEALAGAILASDYTLNIGSCLRRGWALVQSDFWPIVGVCALILLLAHAASSTAVGIVVGGPLMGGLWLYLLKRARGQTADIETGFSGFKIAFVDLFLASFVTFVLTLVGLFCFILPGIYLAVAWIFALILVIDQRLPFWQAMELSRKVVTRHWFKFFGFCLFLLLMNGLGLLFCFVGVFLTAPISLAAIVYAYEDIFGPARQEIANAGAGVAGSAATVRLRTAGSGGGAWKPVAAGLVTLVFLFLLIGVFVLARARRRSEAQAAIMQQAIAQELAVRSGGRPNFAYGPVIERVLEFNQLNRRALNLASGKFVAPTNKRPLIFLPQGSGTLREAAVDVYLSDSALEQLTNRAAAEQSEVPSLTALDFRALEPLVITDSSDAVADITNVVNGIFDASDQELRAPAQEEQNITGTNLLKFVARDGTRGVLQIAGVSEDPPGIKLLYKVLAPSGSTREALMDRLEAAEGIGSVNERSAAFVRVTVDSARIGDADLVRRALEQITDSRMRDQAALEAARLLSRGQLRKQAIEIARLIISNELRDQALSELAR